MITHFLPQFLMERFRRGGLFELEISTGTIRQRSLKNAGSGDDLWPAEIEMGMMGEYDDAASKILRAKVWDRNRIDLMLADREALGCWLALFMPRVPIVLETFIKVREEFDANPELAVQVMYDNPQEVLAIMQKDDPARYDQTIAELGKESGERALIELAVGRVRRKEVPYLPDPSATHHQHLLDAEPEMRKMGKRIARMHWTWYRSKVGFCISDDPFVRWGTTLKAPAWNIPDHKNVEVTMPVSHELTLCITKRSNRRESTDVVACDRNRTRTFNHRQRVTALKHVYACDRALLNPAAKHGFDVPLPEAITNKEILFPGKLRRYAGQVEG